MSFSASTLLFSWQSSSLSRPLQATRNPHWSASQCELRAMSWARTELSHRGLAARSPPTGNKATGAYWA